MPITVFIEGHILKIGDCINNTKHNFCNLVRTTQWCSGRCNETTDLRVQWKVSARFISFHFVHHQLVPDHMYSTYAAKEVLFVSRRKTTTSHQILAEGSLILH